MEVHLAVGERADRLAVFADIGDEHYRGMAAYELRRMNLGRWAEHLGEANLVLFGEMLIAQQDDEVLVPDVAHLRDGSVVERVAQVDADDLGAERRRQRPGLQRCRVELGVQSNLSLFHCHRSVGPMRLEAPTIPRRPRASGDPYSRGRVYGSPLARGRR